MTAFLVDSMLGKLARLLRLIGFDASFYLHRSDAELIDIAREQDRIILTRDKELSKVKRIGSLFITSLQPEKQVRQVIEKFKLKVNPHRFFCRCLECNVPLERIEKNEVADKVPSRSYAGFDEFWHCNSCGRVYWPGSHYENMMKKIHAFIK